MRISVKKYEGVFYRERLELFNGRPDRTFEICWNADGKKHWRTIGRLSQGVTAQDAAQVRAEILSGHPPPGVPAKTPTVAEIMRPHINKTSCSISQHIVQAIGSLKLSDLTPATIDDFIAGLTQRGLRPATVAYYINELATSINRAIRDRVWSGFNPLSKAAGFKLPKASNKGERWLSPDEAQKLLAALSVSSPLWHDLALVSLHTGMRLCELYRVKACDVDLSTQTAIVTAKGGNREAVSLTPEACEVIAKRGGQPNDLVFRTVKGCRPHDSLPFMEAVNLLGLNDGVTDSRYRVWFHTLRHTFASWLVQSGVDLYTVQKLLRHRNPLMTQRYAHLDPTRFRQPLDIIRQKFHLPQAQEDCRPDLH
jgi:integrase